MAKCQILNSSNKTGVKGLEPSTHRLTADCSAIELHTTMFPSLEGIGMTGFEPVTSGSQNQRSTKLSYIPLI
jgi:hypothetical protein